MTLTDAQQAFVDSLRSEEKTQHQLRMMIQALPRSERMGALLHLFADSNHYGHQQIAGRLLLDVAPTCPSALSDILLGVASNWNPSVEELPRYLADVFGPSVVVDTAQALASQYDDDARERQAMETIAWWLKRRVESGG